jgi:hypothetical protein
MSDVGFADFGPWSTVDGQPPFTFDDSRFTTVYGSFHSKFPITNSFPTYQLINNSTNQPPSLRSQTLNRVSNRRSYCLETDREQCYK